MRIIRNSATWGAHVSDEEYQGNTE